MSGPKDFRVLVLEDEPIIAIALEDLLTECGAAPVTASSLAAAEQLIARQPFDAALLDVNVGSTTSYALAATLRERAVPFIFATGYGNAMHPEGFADVPTITKPYSLADVQSALAKACAAPGPTDAHIGFDRHKGQR